MMRYALAALGLIACGKVVPDSPDASIDIDADPAGIVKVTVLDVVGNGAPTANIPVVFLNPDGTVASDATTDSAGRAEARVLPGASVTAVWIQGTRTLVGTIVDVKPGDDLAIGFTRRDGSDNGNFAVTFPALMGTEFYEIYTPCGSFGAMPGTTMVPLRNNCRRPTFDVYVVAFRNGFASNYAEVQNVSLAAGAVTVPDVWRTTSSFSATYTNVPAEIAEIRTERMSGSRNGFTVGGSGTPMNGLLSVFANNVATAGARAIVRSSLIRNDNALQTISQRVVGNAVNYTLDVGMQVAPWLTNVSFDLETRTIAPNVEGVLPSTVYAADLQFSRDQLSFEWIVLAPTPAPIVLPTMPARVAQVNPLPTDSVGAAVAVVVDVSSIKSWDEARAAGAFDLIDVGIQGDDAFDLVKSQFTFARPQ
ncbi:MAG: hypothetical protein KIT31_43400 [Deltaproteobacteria bacterium]|nr:hypothetical protein [Deltaproteobacteria bacterium]